VCHLAPRHQGTFSGRRRWEVRWQDHYLVARGFRDFTRADVCHLGGRMVRRLRLLSFKLFSFFHTPLTPAMAGLTGSGRLSEPRWRGKT